MEPNVLIPLNRLRELMANSERRDAHSMMSEAKVEKLQDSRVDEVQERETPKNVSSDPETFSKEKNETGPTERKQDKKLKVRQIENNFFLEKLQPLLDKEKIAFVYLKQLINQANSRSIRKKIEDEQKFYEFVVNQGLGSLVKNKHKLSQYGLLPPSHLDK